MDQPEPQIQDVLALTEDLIRQYGPRLAGSENGRRAAERLAGEFGRSCDTAVLEEFAHHPEAFLGHLRFNAIWFLIGAGLLAAGWLWPAAVIFVACHLVTFLEFGLYLELLDPLFRRMTGRNVVARLEPAGEVAEQIVLSAHFDSAYEFRFLSLAPRGYLPLLAAVTLVNAAALIAAGLGVLAGLGVAMPWLPTAWFPWLAVLMLPCNAAFLFFLKPVGTPGAGDNLVAVALLVKLAEIFRARGLRRTRLIFAAYDAEEAGLRGSRAFARRHAAEFKACPTRNLNLESLYDLSALALLTTDINGYVILSRALAKEGRKVARRLGYPARLLPMVYGYGATDAGELAKAGVEATTLLGLNPDFSHGRVLYHTQEDTVANLRPDILKAALAILEAWVRQRDGDAPCP